MFIVTEEVYRNTKIHKVALSLRSAKLAALVAMGLTGNAKTVYWVDEGKGHARETFAMDQGKLKMFQDGSELPFAIEWRAAIG